MVHDEELKETIVKEVKEGASLRKTAKKYNMAISTVNFWCNEQNVSSKHKRHPTIATEKQILKEIKKHKVISQNDLENIFSYKSKALRRRLMQLIKEKKVDYVVLSGGGNKYSEIFRGHIDKRLYYLDKKDLNKWIKSKLPKQMPNGLKCAISQKLHNSGIDIDFVTSKKKAIVVTDDTYNKIKRDAEKEGISITKYVEKAIK